LQIYCKIALKQLDHTHTQAMDSFTVFNHIVEQNRRYRFHYGTCTV